MSYGEQYFWIFESQEQSEHTWYVISQNLFRALALVLKAECRFHRRIHLKDSCRRFNTISRNAEFKTD